MRVNILKIDVSDSKLEEAARNFEDRETMMPYLIMNKRTFGELEKKDIIVQTDKGGHEFCGWDVLINDNLSFGVVDIR